MNGFRCFLISAYFDRNCSIENDLFELEKVVRAAPGGRFLVHADMNARGYRWHDVLQDTRGDILTEWLAQHNFVVHNSKGPPTFVRPDESGCSWIDLTFSDSNTAALVSNWSVNTEIDSLSDHRIIDFELVSSCPPRPSQSTCRFSQLPPSLLKLRSAAENTNLSIGTDCSDTPAIEVDFFNSKLLSLCEEVLPPRKPAKQKKALLWWDSDIRKARALKNRLSKQLKSCVSEQNSEIRAQLDLARSEYRRLLIVKGPIHWRKFLSTVKSDRVYGLLRSLSRPPFSAQPVWDSDDVPLLSDDLAAEHLASSFFGDCLVRPALSAHCSSSDGDELCATENELRQVVFRFGKTKAPGPDGVTATIFRTLFESNPAAFVDCYNLCLQTGTFPEAWKVGSVVMLAKGRPGQLVAKSFRPITLLPFLGKALERLIATRVVESINSGIGFHPSQYGFRAGRSTVDALVDLGRRLNHIRSSGRMALLVSLNITGAFDCVRWPDIIASLDELGVPSFLIQICKSFFDSRCIDLVYNSGRARRWLSRGCPQGSITGPLM